MRYWWVNQNQTYKTEIPGGFLWSPKVKANGGRNQFYLNMQEVTAGDIIFSFCDTLIKAIGVAVGRAASAPKPEFGGVGATWADKGWLVPVEFRELNNQIRPKTHIALLRPFLPEKYSPLQSTGDGLQSVYLAELAAPLAHALIELIGSDYASAVANITAGIFQKDEADDQQEVALIGRTDIGRTEIEQLAKARRGQGIFKANVRLNESRCRVTGVSDLKHLRASHIKPWKDSSDEEKLNGCNGLLLAPHIDHLFDGGSISFSDDGHLLVSGSLDETVLNDWHIPHPMSVGPFSPEQSVFLAYHRRVVFKGE